MSKLKKLLGLGMIAGSLVGKGLEAQTTHTQTDSINPNIETFKANQLEVSLSSDLTHKSRFWALPFLDSPMYKQTLGVNYGDFTASATGVVDVREKRLFDVDVHVGYSHDLNDILSVYGGALRFDFNIDEKEGWDWAALLYGGISANTPLNPSIIFNQLFRFGGGKYIEGTISETADFGKNISSEVAIKLGYNDNALREGKGFTHAESMASATINTGKGFEITPRMHFFRSLSPDVESGPIFGINVTYTF